MLTTEKGIEMFDSIEEINAYEASAGYPHHNPDWEMEQEAARAELAREQDMAYQIGFERDDLEEFGLNEVWEDMQAGEFDY